MQIAHELKYFHHWSIVLTPPPKKKKKKNLKKNRKMSWKSITIFSLKDSGHEIHLHAVTE